jgi:hypothetical protein
LGRPILAPIPGDLARPYVQAYAYKWELPNDFEGFERVLWYGAWVDQALKGVAGYLKVPEMDGLLVYGLYGDGSSGEKRALSALFKHMQAVSQKIKIYGTVHAPNSVMVKAMKKRTKPLGYILGGKAELFVLGA